MKKRLDGKEEEVKRLLRAGYSHSVVAKAIGCSKDTIRRFSHRISSGAKVQTAQSLVPARAVQIDYKSLEAVSLSIIRLQNVGASVDSEPILGSELLTSLLKSKKLYKKLDYSTGEFVWYLVVADRHETLKDKDYILQFQCGRLDIISESYFNLRFSPSVAKLTARKLRKIYE